MLNTYSYGVVSPTNPKGKLRPFSSVDYMLFTPFCSAFPPESVYLLQRARGWNTKTWWAWLVLEDEEEEEDEEGEAWCERRMGCDGGGRVYYRVTVGNTASGRMENSVRE